MAYVAMTRARKNLVIVDDSAKHRMSLPLCPPTRGRCLPPGRARTRDPCCAAPGAAAKFPRGV